MMDTFWMVLGLAVVFLFGFFTGWYTDDHRWQQLIDDVKKDKHTQGDQQLLTRQVSNSLRRQDNDKRRQS